MMSAVDAAEPLAIDVRVDLRGRDVGVTEHLLHRPEVGAVLEEMRGEGMPENVRAEPAVDVALHGVFFQLHPETLPRHRGAPVLDEEKRGHAPPEDRRT